MLVLAVDTSLPFLSVAVVNDAALIGALSMEGKGSRNEKLLPAVDWLLAENAIDRRQIDLFAVTRGPGSFTGVRIGLATVQGLALALGREVCAMSTHEAVAHGAPGRVVVIDDAGRGESYLSEFTGGSESRSPRLASRAEAEAIAAGADVVIRIPEALQRHNFALRCARRALEIAADGSLARYRDITPIYVRLAEAEVKLNSRNA